MRIHSVVAIAVLGSLAVYGPKVVAAAGPPAAAGRAGGTAQPAVAAQRQQAMAARQAAPGQRPLRNQKIAQLLQQPALQGSLQNALNTALNSVLAGRPLTQAAQSATNSLEAAARQELDNPTGTLNTAIQNALTNAYKSVQQGVTVGQAAQNATNAPVSSAQQALNTATGSGVYVPWAAGLIPGLAGQYNGYQIPVGDSTSISGAHRQPPARLFRARRTWPVLRDNIIRPRRLGP